MSDEYDLSRALRVAMAQAWDEGRQAGMDEGHGATITETNPYRENQ